MGKRLRTPPLRLLPPALHCAPLTPTEWNSCAGLAPLDTARRNSLVFGLAPGVSNRRPDRFGPHRVLRVAWVQPVGGDPTPRPDARGAGFADVDPREAARTRRLFGDVVEAPGEVVDAILAAEVGGRGDVRPGGN